jgi:hypothetical protein
LVGYRREHLDINEKATAVQESGVSAYRESS